MRPDFFLRVLLAAVLVLAGMSGGVFAADPTETPEEEEEDDGPVIDFSGITEAIEELSDAFSTFADGLKDTIVNAGVKLVVTPANWLAEKLSAVLTAILTWYPNVRSGETRELHGVVFQLTMLLSTAAMVVIGVLHLTGHKHGFRPLAYVIGVLVAGSLAPEILWIFVELSRLSTVFLLPEDPGFIPVIQVSLLTALVVYLEAFVLLAVVLVFLIRNFYLMFYVAASPLIFLGYLFRHTRKFSATLTGTFTGFLLIGPLDAIIYRLLLSLLNTDGGTSIPNWLVAIGGYSMMLAVPFVILSSGSGFAVPILAAGRHGDIPAVDRVKTRTKEEFDERVGGPAREKWERGKESVKNRFRRDRDREEDDADEDWWDRRW